ncbi:MAG: hypothetical protein IPP69_17485 [Flavobacteriales bacterium]|nr:hypothetical protein [Flavobacteriales bacterium]
MSSKKPHIMTGFKNNMGKEVKMEYKPSTHFYLEDKKAGKLWITKLHFPVHCLTKTTVHDKWRNTTFASNYSYHHGYYDHTEREFRGFGRVEQTDVEDYGTFSNGNINSPYITHDKTLYQPPVKTITWYHTGAYLEKERILNQFKSEYFAPHSTDFTEHQLPEPDISNLDLNVDELNEALRACKGMMLRQEVYELETEAIKSYEEKRVKLFTTAFHNCNIQLIQPRANNHHAVFLVSESESISYNYELNLEDGTLAPDPRISHNLNMNIDKYGNVLESVAIAYKRTSNFTDTSNTLSEETEKLVNEVQHDSHFVYTENNFTTLEANNSESVNHHRLPLLCEVKMFELTNVPKKTPGLYFSLKDFQEANIPSIPKQAYHLLTHSKKFQSE